MVSCASWRTAPVRFGITHWLAGPFGGTSVGVGMSVAVGGSVGGGVVVEPGFDGASQPAATRARTQAPIMAMVRTRFLLSSPRPSSGVAGTFRARTDIHPNERESGDGPRRSRPSPDSRRSYDR